MFPRKRAEKDESDSFGAGVDRVEGEPLVANPDDVGKVPFKIGQAADVVRCVPLRERNILHGVTPVRAFGNFEHATHHGASSHETWLTHHAKSLEFRSTGAA